MHETPAHHERPTPGPWTRAWVTVVAWCTATRGRALLALLVGLMLATACAAIGRGVRVNTDLKSLLPDDAPSVQALRALAKRKGSTEIFTVAVESKDPEARATMVARLAETIGGWPEASEVRTGRDFTPLRDRALYFLDEAELDELIGELSRQKQRAIARKIAADVAAPGQERPAPIDDVLAGDDWDLLDDEDFDAPAPPANPADADAANPDAANPDAANSDPSNAAPPDIAGWVADQKAALLARGDLSAREIDLIWPEENDAGEVVWSPRVEDPYQSTQGDVQVIKAILSQPPTDVTFAREVATRLRDEVAALQAQGVAPGARVQIVAAYNVSRDIDTILRDAKRATALSVVLVTFVLMFGFRTPRALALVLVPMGIATCVTLACARLLLPQLNALTIFMFAVLFGMGVDFSVHLFALRPGDHARSWPAVIASHLRPLTASMLTTACSLAVLGVADFRAFREFGAISAVGVFLCFVCAVVFVPVVDTLWPTPPSATAAPRPPSTVFARGRVAVLALAAGVALIGGPSLAFEKDLRQLNAQPKKGAGIRYGSATGRCSKSVVLVADDAASLDVAVAALGEEQRSEALLPNAPTLPGRPQQPWIRGVYSVAQVLPTEQDRKQTKLASIATLTNDFLAELPDLDAEAQRYRTHLEALEQLSRATPLDAAILPDWARAPFVERNDHDDRLGHVCLRIRNGHLDELVAVKDRFNALLPASVGRADSRLVFADLVSAMHVDARRLPAIALAVILLFIALDLRRLKGTLAIFGTLVLGLGLTVGAMGLVPIHLNFFNLVVMPAVLGLSIDTGIHLWHARTRATAAQTSRATLISAFTTMGGFAGLLAAQHPGLRSIGTLGVVAVLSCIVVAFAALAPRRPANQAPAGDDTP